MIIATIAILAVACLVSYLVHNELNYITVKVRINMLKDDQLCSPGAVSDGGHPMLTEALNGVSYNNLGNSSSVSPSAFTKRQALCQFINVAYILLLTSVALDKFTTSSRDNISISAPQTYLAAVSLSEVVTLGVVLGVTAEPMQQFHRLSIWL